MLKRIYTTIIFLLITTVGVFAESRAIYLDKEIRNSLLTEYVEITNYTDSTIVFKTIKNGKIGSAKAIKAVVKQGQNENNKFGTEYWPSVGDKVLIVVSQDREVSLFATIQNKNYRFWSPIPTGSSAMFLFQKPATNLSGKKGKKVTLQNTENYQTSNEEGCLLPINKLDNLLPLNLTHSEQTIEYKGSRRIKLAGKTYIAKIGETCKDGIGMLFKYSVLKFEKNMVTISYKVIASVAPELKDGYEHMYDNLTKTYQWKMNKDLLIVEGCQECGVLEVKDSKIIKENNGETTIEYVEQTK